MNQHVNNVTYVCWMLEVRIILVTYFIDFLSRH